MRNMIAYCGLDCEKCDAYLATINDDQVLREKTAKSWSELNNIPILPEHINAVQCALSGPYIQNISTARDVGSMGLKRYTVIACVRFVSVH